MKRRLLLTVCIGFVFSSSYISQTVNFQINLQGGVKPISPYIYGTNEVLAEDDNYTAMRQGGNRMTGYNWENNASNAGNDWQHSSDNFLTWVSGILNENEPGIVTTFFHDWAQSLNAYSLVTLQMAGYVAKDKSGNVSEAQTAPSSRWDEVKFVKGSPFSLTPDLTDNYVYMDEFINLLVDNYDKANSYTGVKGYSLDNEPALWPSTHPRIHPAKTTCAEIVQKAIDLSLSVKNVDEYAEIFGPALYGFAAITDFQGAPDWSAVNTGNKYAWFIEYYLDKMKQAETDNGKRLLDVLDIHWYPEAKGDHRITESNATTWKDIQARLQAPRTLWDAKYTEDSWIGQWGKSHLPLIPKIQSSINKFYPGTKLSITEITYGGPTHISGGIAMADAIGIFAKYGVYMSCLWPLTDNAPFLSAAYKIFRNYDGDNSTFGDFYAVSTTNDSVNTSVYGSVKSGTNEIHIIAINKNLLNDVTAAFSISTNHTIQSGRVWAFDSLNAVPEEIGAVANIQNNSFEYELPKGSVCHLVLLTDGIISSVENTNSIPTDYDITLDTYPNPFNPTCRISYSLPSKSEAKLQIVSITGEVVKTFDELSNAGEIEWNSKDENGQQVSSGVYCVVLRDASQILATKKIMLMK
ncbi:MAG: glycoside hydrolase family 44 protein [bacterium]